MQYEVTMQVYNKFGVPLWAIKRALICRINLQNQYQYFDIDDAGSIFLDGKNASHIDLVQWVAGKQHCYIPFLRASPG